MEFPRQEETPEVDFFCGEADMFRFRVFCQFFGFDDIWEKNYI